MEVLTGKLFVLQNLPGDKGVLNLFTTVSVVKNEKPLDLEDDPIFGSKFYLVSFQVVIDKIIYECTGEFKSAEGKFIQDHEGKSVLSMYNEVTLIVRDITRRGWDIETCLSAPGLLISLPGDAILEILTVRYDTE